MAIPVINTPTSVLGFKQYEEWQYQPSATGEPCVWSSSKLPAGMSMAAAPTIFTAPDVTGDDSTDIIDTTGAHGFLNGDKVYFSDLTGGAGLAVSTAYYVRDKTTSTFKLAATLGGTVIDFTTPITAATVSKVYTGLISGAATEAGVFNVSILAANADGASAPLNITIGIEPATGSLHSGVDLFVDLQSGAVTTDTAAAPNAAADAPLFAVKEGDDLILYVRFRRGETVIDLGTLASMEFALKELETETAVTLGGGAVGGVSPDIVLLKTGSGITSTYLVAVKFDGDAIAAALSNYEEDAGTFFNALGELQWVEPNATTVGPTELTRSSQTFRVRVERDLVE